MLNYLEYEFVRKVRRTGTSRVGVTHLGGTRPRRVELSSKPTESRPILIPTFSFAGNKGR
jgi:hypothetical protein